MCIQYTKTTTKNNKNKTTKNKTKTCKYFTSLVGEVLLHYLDPGDTKMDVKRWKRNGPTAKQINMYPNVKNSFILIWSFGWTHVPLPKQLISHSTSEHFRPMLTKKEKKNRKKNQQASVSGSRRTVLDYGPKMHA